MGYKPLSREFLLQRGHCCNNNCLNCPYKEKNMKTEKQDKDSMMNYIIGAIGIGITIILVLALNSTSPQIQEYQDIETELLNEMEMHWDSVNKETKDWTSTTQGEEIPQKQHNFQVGDMYMLDGDMDCGGDILRFNQIHYDSIPRYARFTDVPAGTDKLIIVDEILYKMNNNKTSWTPIYSDEYVMWISNNGDTIWE